MVIPLPFFQVGAKVETPTMGEDSTQEVEINVYPDNSIDHVISCATPGSHIFYKKDGTQPTHSGDTATGGTFRIGASSGTVNMAAHPSNSSAIHYNIVAIGYLPSMNDSDPMSQRFSIYRDSGA